MGKFTRRIVAILAFLTATGSAMASEPPMKRCGAYLMSFVRNDLSGMRWEDVEAVGNQYTAYNPKFNQDFVQQYAGRVGTLIRYDGVGYKVACSASLISVDLLLTAAHCVTVPGHDDGENVGVLFSYQKLGSSEALRVDVGEDRYVDLNDLYDSHQFFPISLLENGWENGSNPVDYAIYSVQNGPKVGQYYFPWFLSAVAETDDQWHWESLGNTQSTFRPWGFGEDNTNGHRGWSVPSARALQPGESIATIGHPGDGPQIISAGNFEEYDYDVAFAFNEDRLLFTGADVWPGSSGSPVFDQNGYVVGLAVWTTCAEPAGPAATQAEIWAAWGDVALGAAEEVVNIATPMWKICEVSDTIQYLTNDRNCNGMRDNFERPFINFPR